MKILIIEDECDLTNTIVKYLKQEYFLCETANNLEEAYHKLWNYNYDCVLLDITLPDGNGLNVLKQIKAEKKNYGVIIISAKHSLDDKINGFKLGADDYLPKPFHLSELSARINSIIRRKHFNGSNEITVGDLLLNYDSKTVWFNNKIIELTRTEYDVLLFLLSAKNKVITKKAIAEHISGDHSDMFDNLDFVYAHLKNLRKKLLNTGCPDHIKSVYGIGYKFQEL